MIGGIAQLLDAILIEFVDIAQLGETLADLCARHVEGNRRIGGIE